MFYYFLMEIQQVLIIFLKFILTNSFYFIEKKKSDIGRMFETFLDLAYNLKVFF